MFILPSRDAGASRTVGVASDKAFQSSEKDGDRTTWHEGIGHPAGLENTRRAGTSARDDIMTESGEGTSVRDVDKETIRHDSEGREREGLAP